MDKNALLLSFMAQACQSAQSHVGCPDTWTAMKCSRQSTLQCTSFQVACFLAQNTRDGSHGVEWDIVINELIDNKLDENGMMVKSEEKWHEILSDLVDDYGGFKDLT